QAEGDIELRLNEARHRVARHVVANAGEDAEPDQKPRPALACDVLRPLRQIEVEHARRGGERRRADPGDRQRLTEKIARGGGGGFRLSHFFPTEIRSARLPAARRRWL